MAKASHATAASPELVAHMAQLSAIPVSSDEVTTLTAAFEETLQVVDQLTELDTSQVSATHRVTGLSNVWREDTPLDTQSLSQAEALRNARRSHQGFFVVNRVLDQEV